MQRSPMLLWAWSPSVPALQVMGAVCGNEYDAAAAGLSVTLARARAWFFELLPPWYEPRILARVTVAPCAEVSAVGTITDPAEIMVYEITRIGRAEFYVDFPP